MYGKVSPFKCVVCLVYDLFYMLILIKKNIYIYDINPSILALSGKLCEELVRNLSLTIRAVFSNVAKFCSLKQWALIEP